MTAQHGPDRRLIGFDRDERHHIPVQCARCDARTWLGSENFQVLVRHPAWPVFCDACVLGLARQTGHLDIALLGKRAPESDE